jgi:signal transduction histidine kinase
LEPALRALASEFRAGTGLNVTLRCSHGTRRLPANIEEALYRIAQEALTNIERHAAAHQVTMRLTRSARCARMRVHHDGRGFTTAKSNDGNASSFGLLYIRERADLAGGTFALTTAPGRGTEIAVEFPLPLQTLKHAR